MTCVIMHFIHMCCSIDIVYRTFSVPLKKMCDMFFVHTERLQ